MPEERVTLRDIMKVNQDLMDAIESLEKKIDNKVTTNSNEIYNLKAEIGIIKTKISSAATLQLSISIILSALATWLGVKGGL